jgi:hypothetical protein
VTTTFLRSRVDDQTYASADSYEASAYSDQSSLGRLPLFAFSLNNLTTITTIRSFARTRPGRAGSGRATLLLAVLEADGPDTVTLRQGAERGKEVSVMRCLCGDDDGELAKITAWREPAEEMGAAGVRRGDVIHFDGISASFALKLPLTDGIGRVARDVGRGRRDVLHRCAHPPHACDGVLPHATRARRAFGPCASARPEARRERAGGAAGAECRRMVRASCGAAVRYACEVYTNDLYMRNGFDAYLSGFE